MKIEILVWAVAGLLAAMVWLTPAPAMAQDEPTFASLTEGAERREGVFDLYVDAKAGTLHAAFPTSEGAVLGRYIYTARLTAGLGSNPVGLDRGFGIGGHILRVERVGSRIHFIFENHDFRAIGAGKDERLATDQSFAESRR